MPKNAKKARIKQPIVMATVVRILFFLSLSKTFKFSQYTSRGKQAEETLRFTSFKNLLAVRIVLMTWMAKC